MIDLTRQYTVYMHLFPNGKKYIGITRQNIYKRWDNGYGYMHDKHTIMARAIRKYGWDNIYHIIIKNNITHDEANALEKALIQHYKTTDSNYGYNITCGGDGIYGYTHSCATKKKMRQSALGRVFTSQHIDNLRASHIGYVMPDEQKRKIGESGRKAVAEGRGHITHVKCVETGECFNTITDAANQYGVSVTGISNVLHKRSNICGGYHWAAI